MSSQSLAPVPSIPDLLRGVAQALEQLGALVRLAADADHASDPDPLLTVAEAAVELRRSPAYVREQCRTGAIKSLRDGKGYRARLSALRAYERRRTA